MKARRQLRRNDGSTRVLSILVSVYKADEEVSIDLITKLGSAAECGGYVSVHGRTIRLSKIAIPFVPKLTQVTFAVAPVGFNTHM